MKFIATVDYGDAGGIDQRFRKDRVSALNMNCESGKITVSLDNGNSIQWVSDFPFDSMHALEEELELEK